MNLSDTVMYFQSICYSIQ